MRASEFARSASERLRTTRGLQCRDPQLHARQILQAVMHKDASQIFLEWEKPLEDRELTTAEALLKRRLSGEPFQYIVGREGFWKNDFSVGPGVLIPRPETEILVECFLKHAQEDEKVAELGAGTGNIGISVLQSLDVRWHAFEKSEEAIPYVKENRRDHLPVRSSYHLHTRDFFEGVPSFAPYDWLVSNPPYLSAAEMDSLPVELTYEPEVALLGGQDGLEIIRQFVQAGRKYLKVGGGILFEIGYRQADAVVQLLEDTLFQNTQILKDYSGLPRVAFARKAE